MRQSWWGRTNLPIVRAEQIERGSVIAYNGLPVEVSEVLNSEGPGALHLVFAEPVGPPGSQVVGWDLAPDDPLNIFTF